MFRKISLALAAATVVATAAIPTAASANHWKHRHHHHHRGVTVGFYAPPVYAYAGPRCYVTRKWVHTHWGWQKIKVRRCH